MNTSNKLSGNVLKMGPFPTFLLTGILQRCHFVIQQGDQPKPELPGVKDASRVSLLLCSMLTGRRTAGGIGPSEHRVRVWLGAGEQVLLWPHLEHSERLEGATVLCESV